MARPANATNRAEPEPSNQPAASINAASRDRANFGASREMKACSAWKPSGETTAGASCFLTSRISTHQKTEMRPKTDRISVAKLRLGDFHKGERQRAATHSA